LIASTFVDYPGEVNPGGYNVQGTVTVTAGTAALTQDIAWDLTGVDARCNSWVSGPGGPHCGLHIHPGVSCDSHELVDSYNGLHRDSWVETSHSDDGVWQVTPATNFMGSSYSTTESVFTVSDPDVGHTSASSPFCVSNGMTSPCTYMHLAGSANECQSPAPPDGCHRYYTVKYSSCPELDNFDFDARIDTTGAFTSVVAATGSYTIESGQELAGLAGHAFVVHSWDMSTAPYGGERLACGLLSDDGQGGLIASTFVDYPGDVNPGGYNVQGTVTVTAGTAALTQDIAWDLTGVDARCNSWVSGPGGPHCGLHIHPGVSCDSHELVDSYNGLHRDSWVETSHSDDGVWQVTPATNFMGSSYSTTESEVFAACADRVISSEVNCYGPPADLPAGCDCSLAGPQ